MKVPGKIRTELTEMLGIDYPIIGAPMFLVSYEKLAAAVSLAGGLGTLPLPNFRTVDELRRTLESVRRCTDRPIGVNIHLSGKFAWREQMAVCLDFGVRFFLTSLGDPQLILDAVHGKGGVVFADVVSLRQALRAREKGVDGLVAVGSAAGGHSGTTPTMILVPYLKAKTGLPIVAAGGVSTGAQMAAAIAVGACGVVVGTRLIATPEARVAKAYKDAVVRADPDDIVTSDRITGNPANWLAESIRVFDERPDPASKRWRDFWSAGRSVAQTEEVRPAGEIVREMAATYFEAVRVLKGTLPGEDPR
ncbi:MAG: 2-nitropropane dioxygenase [Deltaproteobacteria bacterium HGW-Deltaproteobacteria-19]|jgi:nitronate monooxygenase|nr:MAG: 2-nitropropane dioxygenase [Deltaproteobacteria bacterium HGW-Deltaproteobacteria-19]